MVQLCIKMHLKSAGTLPSCANAVHHMLQGLHAEQPKVQLMPPPDHFCQAVKLAACKSSSMLALEASFAIGAVAPCPRTIPPEIPQDPEEAPKCWLSHQLLQADPSVATGISMLTMDYFLCCISMLRIGPLGWAGYGSQEILDPLYLPRLAHAQSCTSPESAHTRCCTHCSHRAGSASGSGTWWGQHGTGAGSCLSQGSLAHDHSCNGPALHPQSASRFQPVGQAMSEGSSSAWV